MLEPGERPTDINAVKNTIEKSIDDNNLLMYYKNNKSTLNKMNVHQRNFSSNSTNLNSIK